LIKVGESVDNEVPQVFTFTNGIVLYCKSFEIWQCFQFRYL